MKRLVVICTIITLVTVGCGASKSDSDINATFSQEENAEKVEETSGAVEVDENILTVDVTISASLFGDEEITQESLDEEIADEDGIKSAKLNDDGSVTYTITKAKQKEMLIDMREDVAEYCQEIVDSEDYTFTSIDFNDDVTEFECILTNREPNIYESFAVIGLFMQGGLYNMFAGNEDFDIKVNYINEDSRDVIYTNTYKEWIEKTSNTDGE